MTKLIDYATLMRRNPRMQNFQKSGKIIKRRALVTWTGSDVLIQWVQRDAQMQNFQKSIKMIKERAL